MSRQLFLLAVIFLLSFAKSSWADQIWLDKTEAFLVYSNSGKLSPDLLAKRNTPLKLWNTKTGEGDVGGPADDVLIVLHFRRAINGNTVQPIHFRAMHKDNKLIFEDKDVKLAKPDAPNNARAFLLREVTCQPLVLALDVGKPFWSEEIPFGCGEK
jgi:hypothetical protein